MPVDASEIERLIRDAFPQAEVEVVDTVGDRNHYAARVVAPEFRGKNRVQQQRLVNKALAPLLEGSSAPLHAIALTTAAPD
ncbi:MAG TPA: BolA family transcriptional regulator [Thermohalobaculum sp.]|nr:BolA family transcriptional regulator [Thermohalobaculum sp.]